MWSSDIIKYYLTNLIMIDIIICSYFQISSVSIISSSLSNLIQNLTHCSELDEKMLRCRFAKEFCIFRWFAFQPRPCFDLNESVCTIYSQPNRCAKTEPKTTIDFFVSVKKVTPLVTLLFFTLSNSLSTNVVLFYFCLQRNYSSALTKLFRFAILLLGRGRH